MEGALNGHCCGALADPIVERKSKFLKIMYHNVWSNHVCDHVIKLLFGHEMGDQSGNLLY